MKTLLGTLMLATLGAAPAAASSALMISFDQPDQIAMPGQLLQFSGTITNLTGQTMFLKSDDANLSGLSLALLDEFFTNVPHLLAPSGQMGDSSGDITLFLVDVRAPLLDPPSTYLGLYTLLGGADAEAQDTLGIAGFTVITATPEPSTIYLMLAAIMAASMWSLGRARQRVSGRLI